MPGVFLAYTAWVAVGRVQAGKGGHPDRGERVLPEVQTTKAVTVEAVPAGPNREAVVISETRGASATNPTGSGQLTRRVIARYRLLSGSASQLRSRLAQMEARLSALEQKMQKATPEQGELEAESNALRGVLEALRGEQSQVLAELSRLQGLLAELA